MRSKEEIMTEYAQVSARAGEHRYKITKLYDDIKKHEYEEEKLFNKLDSLTKEYISTTKGEKVEEKSLDQEVKNETI